MASDAPQVGGAGEKRGDRGRGTGILTNSGGPCIICADADANHGLHLLGLQPETTDELRSFLPEIASVYNPVNTTAGAFAPLYHRCLSTLLEDCNVDAAIIIVTPTATLKALDLA